MLSCLPQVTVVIPACLDDAAGVLDDTLRAHARLAYCGPLSVLLVYHKGPAADLAAGLRLEEAESELRAVWAGREEGNVRWGLAEMSGQVRVER